jgi:uncharacterized membrane protein (UPF0127 family)
VLVDRLEIADRYASRLLGLQFRARPAPGFGLLLAPCASIHTCFVRFAIDAVMLDRAGRVLEVRRGVRPWRVVVPALPTYAFLEVPSGSELPIEAGQLLGLESPAGPAGGRRLSGVLATWVGPT